MNSELMLLVDQRHAERRAKPSLRPVPDTRPTRRLSQWPKPSSTKRDFQTMNTWHIDTSMYLHLAQLKHEDMIRAAMLHKTLRELNGSQSVTQRVRLSLANALITLGQAMKPDSRSEDWTGSAPRTAA
ncbi:MAG: hypothetical protein QM589_08460 [Thermomicrobiales bacterium]